MFCQFRVFPKPKQVLLADHYHTALALGQGRVYLTDSLVLDEVSLVPSFPISLLSLKKLTSLKYQVSFTNSMCVFQDVATSRVLGHGISKQGLWIPSAPFFPL